jgi:hypothetical protein
LDRGFPPRLVTALGARGYEAFADLGAGYLFRKSS